MSTEQTGGYITSTIATSTNATSTKQSATTTTTSEITTTTTAATTTSSTTIYPMVSSEEVINTESIIPATEAPIEQEEIIAPTEAAAIEDTEQQIESVEAASDEQMTYIGNLKITGYVATGNPTASGEYPYIGGVAMSRNYDLPFGSTIYIEGLGYYTVNDTGCKYGVVDVFCGNVNECYDLTSYADVYLVE